jgi:RNA polymerase sigma-70 factor (ECF subfamily)
MEPTKVAQATQIVNRMVAGNREASEQLFALLYDDFRKLAGMYLKKERPGHTLQPTALVHEAYLKLIDQTRVEWHGRTHFFAVGAQAMRRILVDHARRRKRLKHGGGRFRISLKEGLALSPKRDEDLLAVDEALERLTAVDPRQATIVELRFFGGLNVAEVAEVLGVSKRTVEKEWTMVRAWLRRELDGDEPA